MTTGMSEETAPYGGGSAGAGPADAPPRRRGGTQHPR